MAQNVIQHPMEPLGFVQLTGLTTAQGLESIPSGATVVWLQASVQGVRVRFDGIDPTASVGSLIVAGQEGVLICLTDLTKIRVINDTAGAVLNVSYFRPKPTG